MYGFSDHLKPMPLTGLRALLQGSSRYSIPMATEGSIEQTFVQLEDGIRRLTLPLPTGPKHVHCYLAGGTLFDTGLGLADGPWSAVAEDRIAQGHAFAPFIRYAVEPDLLYEGSEVDGWQVLELPGHADGHLGFLRDGVLIAGDHLLQRISPAVGLYPESRPDPLGDYLASLERTIELAPRIVYPGHGEPILDADVRARELIEHHRRRLDETAAALGDEPRSAYEISLDVFGTDLEPTQRRFAVAETLSHLERLVREGRAARAGHDQQVFYTGP